MSEECRVMSVNDESRVMSAKCIPLAPCSLPLAPCSLLPAPCPFDYPLTSHPEFFSEKFNNLRNNTYICNLYPILK